MFLNQEQVAIVSNRITHKWSKVVGPRKLSVRWPKKLECVVVLAGDQPYYVYPNVMLVDGLQVEIQIQVFYAPTVERMLDSGLFKLPALARSNWQTPLREYGNYLVRRALAKLNWRQILSVPEQEVLELEWKGKLDKGLSGLGIRVKEVRLIWVTFPREVQEMIEKEAKLSIVKAMVDEETYKHVVAQEFSKTMGGFMWPGGQ